MVLEFPKSTQAAKKYKLIKSHLYIVTKACRRTFGSALILPFIVYMQTIITTVTRSRLSMGSHSHGHVLNLPMAGMSSEDLGSTYNNVQVIFYLL